MATRGHTEEPVQPPATNRTESGRFITIHVVKATTKQPIPGVAIGWYQEKKKIRGRTDAAGSFKIELPEKEPQSFYVDAHTAGYVPMKVRWTMGGVFHLPPEFTFTLERGTSIGGIIQNEQGQPISNVAVFVIANIELPENNPNQEVNVDIWNTKVVTDGAGHWHFDRAPAKISSLYLRLAHPEYIGGDYPELLPTAKLRDLTSVAVMKKGLAVTGLVSDANGRPIPGAKVQQGSDRHGTSYPTTKTDATGAFRFANSTAGPMVLTFQADGFSPEMQPVEVGPKTAPVTVRLAKGNTLHGRVVDKAGNPIPGVMVGADTWRKNRTLEWRTETDAEGRFSWNSAPPDEVKCFIGKQGFMSTQFDLKPAKDEQVITLRSQGRLHGTVVDANSSQPISQFQILLGTPRDAAGTPYWLPSSAKTFTNGRYEVPLTRQGATGFVRVEADGYLPAASPAFQVDKDDIIFDFRLTKGISVSGVVRTPDSAAVANAKVYFVTGTDPLFLVNGQRDERSPTRPRMVVTEKDGRYTFAPPDKPYLIVALHDQGYAQTAIETTGATRDLVLTPWARVEGVRRIGNRVAAGGKVHLAGIQSFHRDQPYVMVEAEAVCDERGHFVVEHVPAGNVSVSGGGTGQLQTQPGETTHLTLGGTGRPVTGQLVAPVGSKGQVNWTKCWIGLQTKLDDRVKQQPPADWATMTAEQRQAWVKQSQAAREAWKNSAEGKAYFQAFRRYDATVQPDGSFRAEDIEAGPYEFTASLRPAATDSGAEQIIWMLHHEFSVPAMPGGRSDEPLNLGVLPLESSQPHP